MRKTLGVAVAVCMAAAAVLFGGGTAGADVADGTIHVVPAGDMGVLASPKCSGTGTWGKIRYQVCVQYNCDSNSCFHRGYLGLINTAASARTVTWDLDWSQVDLANWYNDDADSVTLAAGQQLTIYSRNTVNTLYCDFSGQRRLRVGYDSSGFSPFIQVSDLMACV